MLSDKIKILRKAEKLSKEELASYQSRIKHKRAVALRVVFLTALCIFSLLLTSCSLEPKITRATENEIKVNIRLNLDEDIGLLIYEQDVNGIQRFGGLSNANRSMIKKDDHYLYWDFDRELYSEEANYDASNHEDGASAVSDVNSMPDTVPVTLRFTVVTKYYEPNYDNDYPEEDMVPMNEVTFMADFGTTYVLEITGNRTDGYHAEIVEILQ